MITLTQKQANDIAKIFIASPLLLGNEFDCDNLSEADNEKVRKVINDVATKLLGQTKVGCTAVTDFEAVSSVLNHKD